MQLAVFPNDTSASPVRNCHMGSSQRSTVAVGPLGPDQSRGNLGKSRLRRFGLLKAFMALVYELVATLPGPLAASSAITGC